MKRTNFNIVRKFTFGASLIILGAMTVAVSASAQEESAQAMEAQMTEADETGAALDQIPQPPQEDILGEPIFMDAPPAAVMNEIPTFTQQPRVPAIEGKALTLRDAVATGMMTNPETGVVQTNRRATDEELRQAQALYLPSIDLNADAGFEHSDDPGTRGGLDNDDEENLWRYDAGITLTQMLFDGFETKYENARQEMRVLSASNRVREAAELVGLAIVESYLEVMRQRELLKISRENVAQHIDILDQIRDSAEAGRSTDADLQQARARLASARAQEASIRQSLRTAEAAFIREVGDPPGDLVMPGAPLDKLSPDVERAVKVTLEQSPTLDIFEADIAVANAEFEASKSVFYPQVDLQLNARQGHDLGGVEGRDTSASALVVMDWNLYRGGGDTARSREFINREAQAKEARAEAARDVENNVRTTWAQMISAGERAQQFSAQVDANREVVKAYMDQFDLSRRTLLDVLDSQNELFVSKSSLVNAQFVEIFAVYSLLALRGDLLPTLNIAYPREANPSEM